MSSKFISLDQTLYDYVLACSLRESPALSRLRAETATLPMAVMQIAPEQGQFMAMLVKLTGARRAIEVGVYTGYSALAVAAALPDDGLLIACDIDAQTTAIAQRYWRQAGVAKKIDLRLAPAAQTLQALLDEGQAGSFDFAFIDADKTGYQQYYELCLQLLRPGGLIIVDNVLWGGAVLDAQTDDDDTRAIQHFNAQLHGDQRIDLSVLPLADGLGLLRKR
ncbi:MAG: class I SAM-dependent methyltransferase [Gammaproteobacteria bacterium]|nr:class I SAM-dependent methyltransferase [Gammaproteobacteria bacterium]MBQ0840665.1 class I SAM-dependent methyltransferase [Gammaproteobacteria bacterium]